VPQQFGGGGNQTSNVPQQFGGGGQQNQQGGMLQNALNSVSNFIGQTTSNSNNSSNPNNEIKINQILQKMRLQEMPLRVEIRKNLDLETQTSTVLKS